MRDKGLAHIGIGYATGDDKALEAVKIAVESPLLETKINGATHVIINISGDISLMDANDAASYVQDLAGEEANIIFGAKYDETMDDAVSISVMATGLGEEEKKSTRTRGVLSVSSSGALSSMGQAEGDIQMKPIQQPKPKDISIPKFLQQPKK